MCFFFKCSIWRSWSFEHLLTGEVTLESCLLRQTFNMFPIERNAYGIASTGHRFLLAHGAVSDEQGLLLAQMLP